MTVERNNRRTKVGVVVSNKMDKTITVAVESIKDIHYTAKYTKLQRNSKLTMKITNAISVTL